MSTIGDPFPSSIPKISRRTPAKAPASFPPDRVSSTSGLDPDVLRLRELRRQTAPAVAPPSMPGSFYRIDSSTEAPRGQPQLSSYPGEIHYSEKL